MQICYISSEPLPPEEGIGFYIWNLAQHIVSQGHQAHIITRGGRANLTKEVLDRVTIWRPRFLPIYPLHVHLHQPFVNRVVQQLEHEVDLFHVHSPLAPVISTQRPVMLTVHSAIRSDAERTQLKDIHSLLLKMQAPISFQLEGQSLRRANKVTVVAPHVVDDLQTYPDCPANVDVTWNGVDTSLFQLQENGSSVKAGPTAESKRNDDTGDQEYPPRIVAVGRLVPGKGWEDLLQAAVVIKRSRPNVQIVIAGDGPLRGKLEKQIQHDGLGDNVMLLGHVGERDILAQLYESATIFVMPSHYEGLPTVVLEAMASGCPIVATRVGGVPSMLVDGKSGLLVAPNNPSDLAQAVLQLVDQPEWRQHLGHEARKLAQKRFSWQVIGQTYLEHYQSLAEREENVFA